MSKVVPIQEIIDMCESFNLEFVRIERAKASETPNHHAHTWVYFICPNHREIGEQHTTIASLRKKKHKGCRYCLGLGKKTHDVFLKEMEEQHPDIEVLGTYEKASIPVECKCKVCGTIWKAPPNRMLSGGKTGCPTCGIKIQAQQMLKSNEQFVAELALANPSIIALEPYIQAKTKIKFRCLICGHEWETTPDRALRAKFGCPKCAQGHITDLQTKTNEQFLAELKKVNPDIEPLEEYKTDHTKIKLRCKIHDYVWYAPPNKILHKPTGCPKCAKYTNEQKLWGILDELGYHYEVQKSFDDCRNKYPLPFDIYLTDYNILIEYDGEFHYNAIPIDGNINKAKERLLGTQERDKIKTKYCQDNNIPLIRIPYWEKDNLKGYLLQELNKIISH